MPFVADNAMKWDYQQQNVKVENIEGTFTLSTAKCDDTKHILFKTEIGDKKVEEV